MNSPPCHFHYDLYHYRPDPTIITTHTFLNPHAYQQPTHNNTYSATAQYWASHPPLSHQQQPYINTKTSAVPASASSPISTTDIKFLLNQLLQSQENLKHTLSLFANEVSLLKTTLTPSSPHLDSHNTTHTFFQQQSFVMQTPFSHQQLKTTPTSFHHAQHVTLPDEPTPFNTKPSSRPVSISHKPSHHYQPQTISTTATVQLSSPTVITETNTVKTQKPTTHSENELVVTTKLVEPEINETKESHEIIVVEGDFIHIVDSASKVDNQEIKCVQDLVAISDPGTNFFEEQKRDVVKDLKTLFSATSTPSTETKVLCGVAVAETHSQPSHFLFNLSDFHICIFDPGGVLTTSVCSMVRRRLPTLNLRSFAMFNCCYGAFFPATTLLPAPVLINSLLSLLWAPWDRGRKIWELDDCYGIQKHIVARGYVDVFDPGVIHSSFVSRHRILVALRVLVLSQSGIM